MQFSVTEILFCFYILLTSVGFISMSMGAFHFRSSRNLNGSTAAFGNHVCQDARFHCIAVTCKCLFPIKNLAQT